MEGYSSSKKLTWLFFGAALFSVFGFRATAVQAASLYLSPTSAEYNVGRTFYVTVGVSSASQAVNAVSASISFSTDKLEVTDVSKSGTVMGLWVKEPSFSNTNGTVNFEGIILNPGFTGNAGKLIVIGFKTKAAGTATVTVSSGSILANDGLGSNITSGLGRAVFDISAKDKAVIVPAPADAPPVVVAKPGQVQPLAISSSSHPDSGLWYSKNIADLQWVLPKGVTGVSVLVDQKPFSVPGTVSDGLFDNYSTNRLDDGIWYFHLRTKNAAGWGPASHFRFQIDTTVPSNFLIKFIDGNQTKNPQPTVVFNTVDTGSGIDHYEVKVGDDNSMIITADEVKSNPYKIPTQLPGGHRVLVVAVDKAGNHSSSSADFTIEALNKPVIVQYPEELRVGDTLTIKGRTDYPDTPVKVWVQADDGPTGGATVRTDSKGNFSYIVDGKLHAGIYKLWAQVCDDNGGTSELSAKVTVVVKENSLFSIAQQDINIWFIFIPLAALIVGYVVFLAVLRRRTRFYINKLGKNIIDLKEFNHHSFDDLRENLFERIKIIEQSRQTKHLTLLERKLLSEFRKELNELEKHIEKRIDLMGIPKDL